LPAKGPAPTITRLSPNYGSLKGGTAVTIIGTNLGHPVSVRFGPIYGKITKAVSDTEIEVTAPAGKGVIDVFVSTPSGISAAGPETHYSYYGGPAVTGIEPSVGLSSGGTTVYVKGHNFVGDVSVRFGSVEATVVKVIGPNDVEVKTPKGYGVVDVVVSTPIGTSSKISADHFTFREGDPTVTSISPTSGPVGGGNSVTIKGTNLLGATALHFGSVSAKIDKDVSASSLVVTAPAGQGTVHVTVTTPAGLSAKTHADEYSYNVVSATRHPHPGAVQAHQRARGRR
jgi:hypothetical protein